MIYNSWQEIYLEAIKQACYINIQTLLQPNRCISQNKHIVLVGPKPFRQYKITPFL